MAARGSLYLLQIALLFQLLFAAIGAQDSQANNNDNASTTVESIFDSAKGIKVGGSILAVLAIAAGAVVCLAGYKLFRSALFVVGFALGGVVVAMIAEEIFKNKSWVVTASWVAFVVGGIVIGCLVIAFYSLSIFLAGAAGGVVLAMLVNTSFGYKIYPSHPSVVLLVLAVVLGIIGGALALKLEKPVLIIATAFVGAAMLVWGVGYFAGDFPSSSDLKAFANQDANGDWVYSIPSAWWAYLAGILVLAVLGAAVQFRKTGRGVTHSRKSHRSHGAPWRSHAVPSSRAAEQEDQVFVEVQTPQKDSRAHFGNPVSHV